MLRVIKKCGWVKVCVSQRGSSLLCATVNKPSIGPRLLGWNSADFRDRQIVVLIKHEAVDAQLTGTGIVLKSIASGTGNSSSSPKTRALNVPSSMKVVLSPNLDGQERKKDEIVNLGNLVAPKGAKPTQTKRLSFLSCNRRQPTSHATKGEGKTSHERGLFTVANRGLETDFVILCDRTNAIPRKIYLLYWHRLSGLEPSHGEETLTAVHPSGGSCCLKFLHTHAGQAARGQHPAQLTSCSSR